MTFDQNAFYQELERHYARRDNHETERFLLDMAERTRGLHDVSILPLSCPSCVETPEINLEYICVCNETACFYRGISRWESSLYFFDEALAELERFSRKDTGNYAVILLNKAGTLRLMGRLEEALCAFKKAEAFFRKDPSRNGYFLASVHNNMALVYQDQSLPEQAAGYLELALSELPSAAETREERAVSLNNLAAIYEKLGNYEAAEQTVEKSISILKNLDGGRNAHYPTALNTAALIRYRRNDYAKAADAFREALEKTEQIYGKDMDYANGCLNLADALYKLDEPEKAALYTEEAEKIREQLRTEGRKPYDSPIDSPGI